MRSKSFKAPAVRKSAPRYPGDGGSQGFQRDVIWWGSVSDRKLGDGYIEARFPLSVLDNYFAKEVSYQIFVHVYRAAGNVPYREGSRLGFTPLQF